MINEGFRFLAQEVNIFQIVGFGDLMKLLEMYERIFILGFSTCGNLHGPQKHAQLSLTSWKMEEEGEWRKALFAIWLEGFEGRLKWRAEVNHWS